MKYLMVCLGNICRTPIAVGLLRKKLAEIGSSSEVDSCGFEPHHIGDPADTRALKVMAEKGIDISAHRARLFHPDDFKNNDLIFAMDTFILADIKRMAKNEDDLKKVDLLLNVQYPGMNCEVPDPYYGDAGGFHKTFEIIDKALDALIEKYEK
ncbi:MAG: low molecular weight protein-tyrosine-phosphatase [Bacteroidales bacterium]|jgi:protein-tyrosine phosphatase|nr:low molecular weight protein-tyrosine-phosphatase [Bacteroidales bacterium]HPB02210.1 low molecular weight protein-tyrosine-phosphatase [Bacteroidales bacterium]